MPNLTTLNTSQKRGIYFFTALLFLMTYGQVYIALSQNANIDYSIIANLILMIVFCYLYPIVRTYWGKLETQLNQTKN